MSLITRKGIEKPLQSERYSENHYNPFTSPYGGPSENKNKKLPGEKPQDQNMILPETGEIKKDLEDLTDIVHQILKKPFKEAIGNLERIILSKTLKECRYNQRAAAKTLGLSYDQFRGLIKKHGGCS
jgi:psp operon transcriptional activator